jgi:hypothetical protein
MRNKRKHKLNPAPDEIIGFFGSVQLSKNPDGLCHLVGGTDAQQQLVRKWCNHFASFLKFAEPPKVHLAISY